MKKDVKTKINGLNMEEESTEFYENLVDVSIPGLEINDEDRRFFAMLDYKFEQIGKEKVTPLKILDNGTVDISEGVYLHGIPIDSTYEEIESRKEHGLLPVEHFGHIESAGECVFCLSVTESCDLEKDCEVKKRYTRYKNLSMFSEKSSVVPAIGFVIDKSATDRDNGKRQLDLFSYVKDKEAYMKKYQLTNDEVALLEFLKANSPNVENIVSGTNRDCFESFNWRAITGGVPSKYVIGIVINPEYLKEKALIESITYEEMLEKVLKQAKMCSEIFNVPVITPDSKVIYKPQNNTENDNL